MQQFRLQIPKHFILFPYNQHYDELKNKPEVIVTYKIVFGNIEVISLEIPFGFLEMICVGVAFNAFIQDAAYNNSLSDEIFPEPEKGNFDERLVEFINNIDDKDDLKDIYFK